MPTEIFAVSDYYKWGQLLKAWVKGEPIPGTGGVAPPKPTTLAELNAQCAAIGLTLTIPATHTKLVIIDGLADTLTIRLPAKEVLEGTEKDLADPNGGDYQLPPFYEQVFGTTPLPMTPDRKLELQAERIGDYAVGMCQ